MQKIFSIDYPPTNSDRWTLVSNAATGLDATKLALAKAVFVTVETAAIRYMYDGTTAFSNSATSYTTTKGHKVSNGGYFQIVDPSGLSLNQLSMINADSSAAAIIQITYY